MTSKNPSLHCKILVFVLIVLFWLYFDYYYLLFIVYIHLYLLDFEKVYLFSGPLITCNDAVFDLIKVLYTFGDIHQ